MAANIQQQPNPGSTNPETMHQPPRTDADPRLVSRRAVLAGLGTLAGASLAGIAWRDIGSGPGTASDTLDPAAVDTNAVDIAPPTPSNAVESDPLPETLTKGELRERAGQIISTFENSTTVIQYGYAENIDDGRGITAGRAGFTSGTHDLLMVVERYIDKKPVDNPLKKYLQRLQEIDEHTGDDELNGSTSGLKGFVKAWEGAAKDQELRDAQDEVYDELYFNPALERAAQAGVTTEVGKAIILDTIVQHGEGEDPDGLPAILDEVLQANGKADGNEEDWLKNFLEIRREHLENAHDPDTRDAWRDSVDRVRALEEILGQDLTLRSELRWTVYGDSFTLPALAR